MAANAPVPGVRHEFVEAGDLRFHVATLGEGDRLALCLHGFPECWISWRYQMPLLARLGYRVWAPDLRGYNETDCPPERTDYAIEKLMADVAALIDAAGARETLLLAHDWGAIIAWYFAMRKLRHLDRLVIMNVPHPIAARPVFRTLRQLRKSWYAMFFQLPRLPERMLAARVDQAFLRTCCHPENFPEEVLAVYREAVRRPGRAKAMIDYYRAFLRGGVQRQHALGEAVIETPTLFLWGEQDVALHIDGTRGTDRWVKDLTFRTLPDASHWVQQDAPETVNRMLEAWLAGEPVPEAKELA